MTEAYIYEAIRTPRGRGKKNGSLRSVKPVDLVVGLIDELQARHPELDPRAIDDIVLDAMVDTFDRPGRLFGNGFYEYAEDGARVGLWPRLIEDYHRPEVDMPFVDMQERMLVACALETARCLEEGVVRSVADANIGSIMGIGFPAWTGGTAQYMNQYAGGLAGFVARADELREKYGDRFVVPDSLRSMAAAGDTYA